MSKPWLAAIAFATVAVLNVAEADNRLAPGPVADRPLHISPTQPASSDAILNLPTFTGSFTYEGNTYTYTMMGGDPQKGGTTVLPTEIQPIRLVFTGTTDPATGNPYVLDGSNRVADVLGSPNFQTANYSVGDNLQFSDAVQIAQFYGVSGPGYHTLLGTPKILPTISFNVPADKATVGKTSIGTVYAKVSYHYFFTLLNRAHAKAHFGVSRIPIVLTDNVELYTGTIRNCCILGFHTYYQEPNYYQLLVWASYVEPSTWPDDIFVDVTALSHEIAEVINDPLLNNIVPAWAYQVAKGCQNNLETGDPIEQFSDASFPVVIGSTTYHPQTEALLQWFARAAPADSFDGAYSYPDMTVLTGPAVDCPAGL